jgi:hypothetical protein
MKSFFRKLGWTFTLLMMCSASYAHAQSTGSSEEVFLHSRIHVTENYQQIDTEERAAVIHENRLLVPEVETRRLVRSLEVMLIANGMIKYFTSAVDFAEASKTVSLMQRFPRIAKMISVSIPLTLIDKFTGSQEADDEKQVLGAMNAAMDVFKNRLAGLAISSPSADERLFFHQQSFREYLNTRQKIDEIFEQESDTIANRKVTIGGIWDYGRSQVEFYHLQLMETEAILAVDAYEANYLKNALSEL